MQFSVKVIPNARKAEVLVLGSGRLKVKVDAPAEKGKANARLIEILAEHFGVAKNAIAILRGAMGREKVVGICETH